MRSLPRRALLAAAAVVLATSAGTAFAEAGKAEGSVKLDAAAQRRLGVAVAPLVGARSAATQSGQARVLDPGPLAALDADIQAAAAAAAASRAEAARARSLHAQDQTVSTKALEAAEAQARGDASHLELLRRRLGLEWGSALSRMSDAQRGAMVGSLAAGRSALLRIDTASGLGQAGLRTVEIDLGPLGRVSARILGPTRTADPHLLSPGLLALAGGPTAASLSIGLTAPIRLQTSGPAAGVILPRAALVRTAGQTWVYVRRDPETFQRTAVTAGRVDPAGLFATSGFRPGEMVAVAGAGALFAAEHGGGEAE